MESVKHATVDKDFLTQPLMTAKGPRTIAQRPQRRHTLCPLPPAHRVLSANLVKTATDYFVPVRPSVAG
jgi:hypothetical protein